MGLNESKESGLNRESPERQVNALWNGASLLSSWPLKHQREASFRLSDSALPLLKLRSCTAIQLNQGQLRELGAHECQCKIYREVSNCFEHLLQQEEDEPAALLCAAARKGCYEMAQQLLSQGTGAINSQDATGRTPLFWATEYRHEGLVELLLSHGADPDVRDKEGNICLHRAAYFGSPTIARMLLGAGSDLNVTNHLGNSPLHLAAQEKCHGCLSLLLACGAVFLKNKAGQLPQQCTHLSSPSCRALQAFSAQLPSQVEQILSRDISRGFEQVAVPCLNMVDQESCPRDFLYITGNIVSGSGLLPTKTRDQSQGCQCDGGCTVARCPCILRSQCSWTLTGGQLRLDTTSTAPEMGSIYECSMLCACPRSCPNRVVQQGLRTQLQLYRTAAKGWGVRTVQDVPHGAFLCQYFGELISNTEAAHREEDTYYFVVDMQDGQQCCLDGRYYGNVGRFLNHSCQPNLVALQVALGYKIPGIAFFSTRAIQAGEELGFDYGDQFWEVKSWNCTCLCGSPGCRRLARSPARLPSPAAGDPGSGPSSPCPPRPPLRGFALKTKRSSPLKRVTRSRLARESRPP